jgi:hypothetical protein
LGNGGRIQWAALVRRQLMPGLTSLLPGTAGLPPFISFSISYPELDSQLTSWISWLVSANATELVWVRFTHTSTLIEFVPASTHSKTPDDEDVEAWLDYVFSRNDDTLKKYNERVQIVQKQLIEGLTR